MHCVRTQGGYAGALLIILAGALMTERALCVRMMVILSRMNLFHAGLSFHTLCRTGVTLAFANRVPVQTIRAHGAWASDAVWQYLKHMDQVTKIVPQALATAFK